MPSAINTVGALTLPLDPGAPNSAFVDPVVVGLLGYFAHWLRVSLNAKLANLQGTSADAVPDPNRFPWDPAAYFVRGRQNGALSPFPALYVWWQGRSTVAAYSTLKDIRQRAIGIAWIYDELVLPGALEDRHGLLAAADSALFSACSERYHPAYAPPGFQAGTPLNVALKLAGRGFAYTGAQFGKMQAIPGDGASSSGTIAGRAEGHFVHAYPTLQATVDVWELCSQFEASDPGDVNSGIEIGVSANDEGGVDDPLPIMTRLLPKPDGTEGP